MRRLRSDEGSTLLLTIFYSALCLALIRLAPAHAPTGAPADASTGAPVADSGARSGSSLRRDLRQGWQEFRARTWMWAVVLIWMGYGVLVFGPLVPLSSALVGARLGQGAGAALMAWARSSKACWSRPT